MKIGMGSIAMESVRMYSEERAAVTVAKMSMQGETKLPVTDDSNISRPSYNKEGMKVVSTVMELKSKVLERLLNALERRGMRSERFKSNETGSLAVPGYKIVVKNTGRYTVSKMHSEFYAETEVTAFKSQGMVTTEDGREIPINFSFEMSRQFEQSMTVFEQEEIILCDPLVLNFDGDVTELSDQKFLLDLDCDGVEDEISHFNSNSAFLAIDLNNDGKINDGSELFGTRSGNGFMDLAQYDLDRNGWIDENDEVFDKLKVWTKDSFGRDIMMTLESKGVGAIYLGAANTRFSLNNCVDNSTKGVIRQSGIFLMEDGEVNTVQHVDFAV